MDFEVAAIPAAARGAFTLEVYAGDGATLLARGREISHPDGSSSLVLGRETLGGDRTYLVVKRFAPPSEPPAPPYPAAVTSYDVSWFTNLTILYGAARGGSPLNLECYEENDGPFDDGDDEMYFDAFSIDVTTIAIGRRIGDFDAASVRSLDSLMFSAAGSDTIAFFYQVQFQLRERDGGAFLDDDFFPMTLFALPPRVQERSGVLRFVEVPAGSGVYGLTYQLTHGFDRE